MHALPASICFSSAAGNGVSSFSRLRSPVIETRQVRRGEPGLDHTIETTNDVE